MPKQAEIDSASLKAYSVIKLGDSCDSLTKAIQQHIRNGRKLEMMGVKLTREAMRIDSGVKLRETPEITPENIDTKE